LLFGRLCSRREKSVWPFTDVLREISPGVTQKFKKTAEVRMSEWVLGWRPDTGALQFGLRIRPASFDFAQDKAESRALPVVLNHFPYLCYPCNRGEVLPWREGKRSVFAEPPQGFGKPWATARQSITLARARQRFFRSAGRRAAGPSVGRDKSGRSSHRRAFLPNFRAAQWQGRARLPMHR